MAYPDLTKQPEHPAVDWTDRTYKKGCGSMVTVTCLRCGKRRYTQAGWVRRHMAEGRFTGHCMRCAKAKTGRSTSHKGGYVMLTRIGCPPEWLPYFDAMRNSTSYVLEHRLAMAHHLGRPLESHELVDHMDGNKQNNHISNLRLYRRGRHDPGTAPGWGVWYHEWQLAEAEVRRLRAELAALV